MPMKFMINDQIVELYPPSDDEEMCNNLRDDNAFTTDMIRKLAATNEIKVQQPIMRITRFITETEDELVYIAEDTAEDTFQYIPHDNSENLDPTAEDCEKNVWDDAQTRFILDQYHTYMTQIGPMKMFKTKKVMWHQIAKDMEAKLRIIKSAIQIENRYKTIIRRKKTAVDNNSKSGSSRQKVQYESELSKILPLDDSIEPECIRSAKTVKRLKEPMIQSDSDEENSANTKRRSTPISRGREKKRKTPSVVETLERLQKEKEHARQERHKEKLQLIRELFGNKA